MRFLIVFLMSTIVLFQTNAQIKPLGIPIHFSAGDWKLISDDFGTSILGHDKVAGPIFIIEHGCETIDDLKKLLDDGYKEEGLELFAQTSARSIDENMVTINWEGSIEGTQVKSEVIGVLGKNKYCRGVSIVTLTQEGTNDSKQKETIKKIAQSIKYIQPTDPQNWTSKLNGHKLVDRESHSSSDSSPDGSFYVSVSSNSSTIYTFCSDGSFRYDHSSTSSTSGSGLDANMAKDNDSAQGSWVIVTIKNTPMVKFMYPFGLVEYKEISRKESGHYYLNGSQYTKGASDYCE